MKVKQIKKQASKMGVLRDDIIATPYGSLVQSCLILNAFRWSDGEFVRRFKQAELPYMDDPDFIEKTLVAVGLEYKDIIGKPVALVSDEHNSIFCPFVFDTDEDEVILLPLYSDGKMLRSQTKAQEKGTWKIINWEGKEEND